MTYVKIARLVLVCALVVGAVVYTRMMRGELGDDPANRIGGAIIVPLVAAIIAITWVVSIPLIGIAAVLYLIASWVRR